MGSEIPANLYPTLVGSEHYKLELLKTQLSSEAFKKHFRLKTTSGAKLWRNRAWIGELFSSQKEAEEKTLPKGSEILSLDEKTYELMLALEDIISINVNDKEGFVSLSVQKIPEAFVVAQVAQSAMELLQKMIIDYKVQNAQKDLNFIEKQYTEKQVEFLKVQEELALFDDRNKTSPQPFFKVNAKKSRPVTIWLFQFIKNSPSSANRPCYKSAKTPLFFQSFDP